MRSLDDLTFKELGCTANRRELTIKNNIKCYDKSHQNEHDIAKLLRIFDSINHQKSPCMTVWFSDSPEVEKLYISELESIVNEQKMQERINAFLKVYGKWEANRKETLKDLELHANSIDCFKENISLGKFILSTASMFGSSVFLATDYLNMKTNWQMKLLTVSGLIGVVSFLCDAMSQYYSKTKVEKIIQLFLQDQDNFEALNSDKQNKFFLDFIEKSFPCGINNDILNEILTSQVEMGKKLKLKIKELEIRYRNLKSQAFETPRRLSMIDPKLQNRFKNYDSISHQRMMQSLKTLELYKFYLEKICSKNSTSHCGVQNNEKIFNVIYFSNAFRKNELAKDTEFIDKARIFSTSSFANLWWKILENKKSAKQAEKKKLYNELESVLKVDKLFWPAISVVALPLSNNYTANALAILVASGIIAFDAFCELAIKIQPKETRILKRLHRIMSSEHEKLKLNRICY